MVNRYFQQLKAVCNCKYPYTEEHVLNAFVLMYCYFVAVLIGSIISCNSHFVKTIEIFVLPPAVQGISPPILLIAKVSPAYCRSKCAENMEIVASSR